jgi:hypothetical protein
MKRSFNQSVDPRHAWVLLIMILTLQTGCNFFSDPPYREDHTPGEEMPDGAGAETPAGLTVSMGNGQLTISWQLVTGATSYNLYRGSSGVTTATGTKITGVTSPYTDSSLTNGQAYYYYIITAENADGESAASVEEGETPQTPVSPLKTGQQQCWDMSGAEIVNCTGTAADSTPSTGQDGQVMAGINPGFSGPTAHATYTTNFTTTDNITGLVWKSCSEGIADGDWTCSGTASTLTWDTASTTTCEALNSANTGAGYAGRTNWRLPTIEELETLVNYNAQNPATFTVNFPATVADYYWSASTYVPFTIYAWPVNFSFGDGNLYYGDKTNSYYVRCVSSP